LARDVTNKNAVYVYDLSIDPQPLFELTADELNARIFTRREDLPEGVERIPIKAIHINKCPIVAPVNVVTPEVAERLGIDLQRCRKHLEQIKAAGRLTEKIQAVFAAREFEEASDPDVAIYSGGFFSSHDRQLMDELRNLTPEQLSNYQPPFNDARLPEMLFRYRARNYPHTLTADEYQQWQGFRNHRLMHDSDAALTLPSYFEYINERLAEPDLPEDKRNVLQQLQQYGQELQSSLAL